MAAPPILCQLHDYIEIACTFRLPIALSITSGKQLKGIAIDTLIKPDKSEHLVFMEEGVETTIQIPMNELIEMKALVENIHFENVKFT